MLYYTRDIDKLGEYMPENKSDLPNHITEGDGWVKPVQNVDGDFYASGKAIERDKRAEDKETKKNIKRTQRAILAAGIATVAAVGASTVEKAILGKNNLDKEREIPEKTASQFPGQSELTPGQLADKAAADAEIRAQEEKIAREASQPGEVPPTVLNQSSEGLDTTNLE